MVNKLKYKLSFSEKLANLITIKLNKYLKKESLELKKMKLGIEIILINLSKFTVILLLAIYFHLLKETIFMSLVFASLRKNSFGIHSSNSLVCTIASSLIFVLGSYISYHIKINNYFILLSFSLINILLYKYAPADTEKHPLLGKKLRSKLRKMTVITGVILMILTLIISSQSIKVMILISTFSQTVTLLPITYKLSNRRYSNYEKFERAAN